jgi:hypothetical protein
MRWAATEAKTLEKPKTVSPPPPPSFGDAPPDVPPRADLVEPPIYGEFGEPLYFEDLDVGELPVAPLHPVAPPSPAQPNTSEYTLEAHCLTFLIEKPDRWYHINRRLRQLAGHDQRLSDGPLRDFGVNDFLDAGFQAMWPLIFEALAQDDYDPTQYVEIAAVGSLRVVFDRLRQPEHQRAIAPLKTPRMEADSQVSWKQFQKSASGIFGGAQDEPINAALRLRVVCLQREAEALQSLVREATDEGDHAHAMYLAQLVFLIHIGRSRIDAELKRQRI